MVHVADVALPGVRPSSASPAVPELDRDMDTISFPVPLHVPDLVATSPDGVAQSEIARAMIVCGTFLQELRHESTR